MNSVIAKKDWWWSAGLFVSAIAAGILVAAAGRDTLSAALPWGAAAALGAAYLLGFLRLHLALNRAPHTSVLLPSLGAGNRVTLARGLLVCMVAGFLPLARPEGAAAWIPAVLYGIAFAADGLDGYLARTRGHVTLLGERLDLEVDALGVLVATVLVVRYGQLPPWYLATGVAYYAFRWHLWLRRRRGRPEHTLPFSTNRRVVGGFQVGFLCVLLCPLFEPPATTLAGVFFAVPFFLSFFRDWLVATGRWNARGLRYQTRRARLRAVLLGRLPSVLRVGVAGAGLYFAVRVWGLPWSTAGAGPAVLGTLTIVSAFLIAAGVAGRIAASGLLVLVCIDLFFSGFALRSGVLLWGALSMMLLGTGSRSLWQPEEALLGHPAGEKALPVHAASFAQPELR